MPGNELSPKADCQTALGYAAIGPVSIEYQAAVIRDELEESAG
jgi:hypothetical protein